MNVKIRFCCLDSSSSSSVTVTAIFKAIYMHHKNRNIKLPLLGNICDQVVAYHFNSSRCALWSLASTNNILQPIPRCRIMWMTWEQNLWPFLNIAWECLFSVHMRAFVTINFLVVTSVAMMITSVVITALTSSVQALFKSFFGVSTAFLFSFSISASPNTLYCIKKFKHVLLKTSWSICLILFSPSSTC